MSEDHEALALTSFGDGYQSAVNHLSEMILPFIEIEDNDGIVRQYIDGEILYAMITRMSVDGGDL